MPSRSTTRRALTLLVLLVLVAPAVTAQVVRNPVRGNFEHTYMVNGRVVSEDGWPVDRVNLTVYVTGLKGLQVEPLSVVTDCHGDFSAYFRLGSLVGDPKVTVTLKEDASVNITQQRQSQEVDTFFRRNDFTFVLDEEWPYGCPGSPTPPRSYWPGRVTLWGRVVEGVGEHTVNGTTLESAPVAYWPVNMTITLDDRSFPPDSVQPTDERGDFKYSWTFDDNLTAARLLVEVLGVEQTVDMDPVTRVAFFKINTGAEPSKPTPAPGVLLVLAAAALAVGFVGGRRRAGGR